MVVLKSQREDQSHSHRRSRSLASSPGTRRRTLLWSILTKDLTSVNSQDPKRQHMLNILHALDIIRKTVTSAEQPDGVV